MLTQDYLKNILRYEPETGEWYWRVNKGKARVGKRAGTLNPNKHYPRGVWKIRIDRKLYSSSRLAFLYQKGRWPELNVIHINLNTSDDRWENLQEASHHKVHSLMNVKPHTKRLARLNKRSNLPLGVFAMNNKFAAQTKLNGQRVHIGTFATPEEASKAYQEFAIANDRWCAMLTSYE